jgi:hypothetical protein
MLHFNAPKIYQNVIFGMQIYHLATQETASSESNKLSKSETLD